MSSEIRDLRKQRGLTQKEAAEKLDMNPRTFGAYERGERTPDYKTMDKIRRTLGSKELDTLGDDARSTHIKKYQVADSDKPSTVYIDDMLIQVGEQMPDTSEAMAHHVNTRWMGPWLDASLVLARDVEKIDGPGRYIIRWAEGNDKVVMECWRHSDTHIAVRTHAPEKTVLFEEVGMEDGLTHLIREDGHELHIEVLGRVVYPSDNVRQMTQGMADTVPPHLRG